MSEQKQETREPIGVHDPTVALSEWFSLYQSFCMPYHRDCVNAEWLNLRFSRLSRFRALCGDLALLGESQGIDTSALLHFQGTVQILDQQGRMIGATGDLLDAIFVVTKRIEARFSIATGSEITQRIDAENDNSTFSITTAEQARAVAEAVKKVPNVVKESFQLPLLEERERFVNENTGRIRFDINSVVMWLERRRPPDKAKLLLRRIYLICNEAEECAKLDIPEFEGSSDGFKDKKLTENGQRYGEMVVIVHMVSKSLLEWAVEIEAEEAEPLGTNGSLCPAAKKPKRSTETGEARVKLIAALTKHHKYADGSCLNQKPIGNNELARKAKVSESTASEFFRKKWGGQAKYKILCRDVTKLVGALKLLNQEFSPHDLYGRNPPGESNREDEE